MLWRVGKVERDTSGGVTVVRESSTGKVKRDMSEALLNLLTVVTSILPPESCNDLDVFNEYRLKIFEMTLV